MLTKNTLEVSKKKQQNFVKIMPSLLWVTPKPYWIFAFVLDALHMSKVGYIFVLSHIDRF